MHIALFGGAFDPPHLGHQQVARSLIEHKIVDEVWFVPVKKHPFDKQLTDDADRLAMLTMILDQGLHQMIETYELHHSEKSFSYLTLQHFQTEFPEHEFSWVIGADNVENFPKWFKYKELLDEFEVYIYPRVGSNHGWTLQPGMVWLEKVAPIDISSSLIKHMLKEGESITDLVDPQVERYIRENQLYL